MAALQCKVGHWSKKVENKSIFSSDAASPTHAWMFFVNNRAIVFHLQTGEYGLMSSSVCGLIENEDTGSMIRPRSVCTHGCNGNIRYLMLVYPGDIDHPPIHVISDESTICTGNYSIGSSVNQAITRFFHPVNVNRDNICSNILIIICDLIVIYAPSMQVGGISVRRFLMRLPVGYVSYMVTFLGIHVLFV